jgi:uncharacterized protein with PhoU and TrkA domain
VQANPACELERDGHKRYLTEVRIPPDSALIGKAPGLTFDKRYDTIEVIEVIRRHQVFYPGRDPLTIAPQDVLLVKGSVSDLLQLYEADSARLPHAPGPEALGGKTAADLVTVEVVVAPQSRFIGEALADTYLLNHQNYHVIAVERGGSRYGRRSMKSMALKMGDILLVTLTWEEMDYLRARPGVIVVEDVHHQIVQKGKAGIAALIFGAMVAAAASGLLDIMVAAISAVFIMF